MRRVAVRMSDAEFESLVAEAVDGLPEPLRARLENVDVVISGEPTRDELERADVGPGATLFGLYQGVPLTERTGWYTFVMPDKITIYRGPILRACADADEVREEVAVTVVHEIAHHFGISDERLDELGW
ncbi:MAG TPA: metallopeptidase family protein [Actinomycetota bacterium]|nr:metallopeptidase family protein [Actinomycetota bacterium]